MTDYIGHKTAGIPTAATSDARVDLDRRRRCGFPEVVYCEGKSPESLVEIIEALDRSGQPYLGTRVSPVQAEALLRRFPDAVYNSVARTVRSARPASTEGAFVAVVTAAMAPGVNSYVFASMYSRGQAQAASAVLLATALLVLTASLWLAILGGVS